MKSFVSLALLSALSLSLPSLAVAKTEASAYATCLIQARQPITASPAYRNASVREKQMLLNSYKAEVTRRSAQCAKTAKPASS